MIPISSCTVSERLNADACTIDTDMQCVDLPAQAENTVDADAAGF